MFDSHLMPLPTPDRADSVEAPMITISATMMPIVDDDRDPSSAMLNSQSPNPMRDSPEMNCSTPKPSVCETPSTVATTATTSTTCPSGPDSFAPKIGVSAERIVSGRPRRYEKYPSARPTMA